MSFQVVGKSHREKNLKLHSLEGHNNVEVDPMCCYESDAILGYIKAGIGFKYGLPVGIKSIIIRLVNDFCTKRWEIVNAASVDAVTCLLEDFDWNFVLQQPLLILLDLMEAAASLRIKSLFNVTCKAIFVMLVGMSVDEIKVFFDMIGFSCKEFDEEMERMPILETWAYQQLV